MKKTTIIAGFPGVGKSTLYRQVRAYNITSKNTINVLDSDSSKFSWVENEAGRQRNPNFPANYIEHIKLYIGDADIILVSTHEDVIAGLIEAGIEFDVVVPYVERKEEFLKLYAQRGNDENFINLVDSNWEKWLNSLHGGTGYNLRILDKGQFLADIVNI